MSTVGDKLPLVGQIQQTYENDNKTLLNMGINYVKTAINDPYAMGGAIFQVGSLLVLGLGEAGAAADGAEGAADVAKGMEIVSDASKLSLLDRARQVADYLGKIPDVVGSTLNELKGMIGDALQSVIEKAKAIEVPTNIGVVEDTAVGLHVGAEMKSVGEISDSIKASVQKVTGLGGDGGCL